MGKAGHGGRRPGAGRKPLIGDQAGRQAGTTLPPDVYDALAKEKGGVAGTLRRLALAWFKRRPR
jgi:hypothetical protein